MRLGCVDMRFSSSMSDVADCSIGRSAADSSRFAAAQKHDIILVLKIIAEDTDADGDCLDFVLTRLPRTIGIKVAALLHFLNTSSIEREMLSRVKKNLSTPSFKDGEEGDAFLWHLFQDLKQYSNSLYQTFAPELGPDALLRKRSSSPEHFSAKRFKHETAHDNRSDVSE